VYSVLVWVISSLLVLVQRVKEEFQEGRVGVEENWMQRENHINSLSVAIGTDFLHEEIHLVSRTAELNSTESLAYSQRGDGQIVLASCGLGVSGNFVIKCGSCAGGRRIVFVEKCELYGISKALLSIHGQHIQQKPRK
jgi:hypothetical protein